jgi:hypothetical protein
MTDQQPPHVPADQPPAAPADVTPDQAPDLTPAEEDALVHTLRSVLAESDPVPDVLLDAARAAFTWRTVDAELAELTADTALAGALVRGGDGPRVLTFALSRATLLVEVIREGAVRQLLGQLLLRGAQATGLRLQRPGGELPVEVDELGHFRLDEVPPGPARFALRLDDRPAVTAWVAL